MEIIKTPISDLVIIKPQVFEDERGYFYESYSKEKLEKLNFNEIFLQDNQSKSNKGVLRGLHLQLPPFAQGKLVQVIHGAVFDVAVDLRKKSTTYGQHYALEINALNKLQMFIPPGFAHGFITLESNTIFNYKCTQYYNKESEGAIAWNDKDLAINWPIKEVSLSGKDKLAMQFCQFNSPF